jgi:thiol-disulfide isomerase/thioredoxin
VKRKSSLACLIFLIFLLLFAAPAFSLEVGSAAPGFQLQTLDGRDVKLSDYRGRPVLLKLATVWCPSCQAASREICGLSRFWADNDITVIEVFLQDSAAGVRDHLKNRDCGGFDQVVVRDDGQVLEAYDVYLIPRLLFLDRDQRIRRDASLVGSREMVETMTRIIACSPGTDSAASGGD